MRPRSADSVVLVFGLRSSLTRMPEQSVIACTGVQILSQSQLGTGTQHTAGLIAAQLAFFDFHGALMKNLVKLLMYREM